MSSNIEKIIANTFLELANGLDSGYIGKRPKIALTGLGSELGEQNSVDGASNAVAQGVDVCYLGKGTSENFKTTQCDDEVACHETMETMLKNGEIDGVVTMHFPFPIGVSTIGKTIVPATGKPMYLASTTGTSATERVESMVRNTIAGISVAKACGIKNPTVGILNVDGANACEAILKKLQSNGLEINFASSNRADGGCIMRGNDMLTGAADIMVMDSLTGNVISKIFSSFTSGGSCETIGWGYGPGIGDEFNELIMIVSRASGSTVIGNAMAYANELVQGNWIEHKNNLFQQAKKAGMEKLLDERKANNKKPTQEAAVVAPPTEIVTSTISGIDVIDLEDATQALWQINIYAQSAMGCTGPIILVSDANRENATMKLKELGFIQE